MSQYGLLHVYTYTHNNVSNKLFYCLFRIEELCLIDISGITIENWTNVMTTLSNRQDCW